MKCMMCLALLVSLAGCSRPALYDWGSYGASVDRLSTAKDVNLPEERDAMAKEVQDTVAAGKQVPPGKFAYVGYLYAITNDPAAARKYFEAEKKAYPESAIFVDRMVGRMR
jgi:hypothetical protein